VLISLNTYISEVPAFSAGFQPKSRNFEELSGISWIFEEF